MYKIILSILFSINASATVFRPQPINDQIKQADGLFIGHFLKSKSVELENGKIATQMIFKMTKELGLQSDLFGMDEVIIHYPGGSKGVERIVVDGVPEFVSGEKVVIFIKSLNNRYWGMNLGYGTYRVINYGQETMMVNYIFPKHPQVGQISLSEFEQRIKSVKGDILKSVSIPVNMPIIAGKEVHLLSHSTSSNEAKIGRSIASESDLEDNTNPSQVHIIWLLGALSILGGIFRLHRQRSNK